MLGQFNKFGIRFAYPEDWAIVDEEDSQWPRRVSVQSPNSGYWELQVYPPDFRPADLSDQTLEAFREEYDDLDSERVHEEIMDHPTMGYDLDFFCMDLLVTCQVRSFTLGGQTLLLICQAESREFETRREVFEAITRSLFREAE